MVGDATINGSETGTSFRQALYFKDGCGFNLHDTMIYEKGCCRYPDAMRYNQVIEYMFVMSKGRPKTFNPIEDKPNVWMGSKVARISQNRRVDGSLVPNSAWKRDKNKCVRDVGRRNNIWRFFAGGKQEIRNHPAVFPKALARDHIISWSNPGDVVLDPMCGSGTTLKMAKELGRHWIGIDISKEYCRLSKRRVDGGRVPLFTM